MSIVQEGKKVAMCSDHAGYELKCIIQGYLESQDIEYTDFGTNSLDSCDYPDFAHPCAEAIEKDECFPGIAMCGSGNGIQNLHVNTTTQMFLCFLPVSSNQPLHSTSLMHSSILNLKVVATSTE